MLLVAGGGGAAGYGKGSTECPGPGFGGPGGGLSGSAGGQLNCNIRPASGGDSQNPGLGPNGDVNYRGGRLQGGAGGGGGGVNGGGGSTMEYGGAGGGAGYVSSILTDASSISGNGRVAPFNDTSQYKKPAADGGSAKDACRSAKSNGQDGLVTISWGE